MNDPGTVALLDQLKAETDQAEQLAPLGQNRRLACLPMIRYAIQHALASADLDTADGAVPILQLNPVYHAQNASAHTRVGTMPIGFTGVCRYCNLCSDPTGWTIPFWVNCGVAIAQIDLCDGCAKHAVDTLDARPQVGIPEE